MTIQQQLDSKLTELADKLGCTETDLLLQIIQMINVAATETNGAYGKHALSTVLEKRVTDRTLILQRLADLDARQTVMLDQISHIRGTLNSALVKLRQKYRIEAKLTRFPDLKELRKKYGYMNHDGTTRLPTTEPNQIEMPVQPAPVQKDNTPTR